MYNKNRIASVLLAFLMLLTFVPYNVEAENQETNGETESKKEISVKINEIESNSDTFPDYVEIINNGEETIDISGWYIMDNDPEKHSEDVLPLAAGTILEPRQIFVFKEGEQFNFGLGKKDEATLFDKDGNIIDQYSWTAHANETYSRVPDAIGEFVDFPNTMGKFNYIETSNDVVINEIESTNSDRDWVEIYNKGNESVDISGWRISDIDTNDETHYSIPLPEGTIIEPKGFFVFEGDIPGDIKHFSFGLGSSDAVYLYDAQNVIKDKHAWEVHAKGGISRIPDGTGLFKDVPLTKGMPNKDAEEVEEPILPELDRLPFPGKQTFEYVDEKPKFLSDSSGLDIVGDTLWAVDNGTAKVWKMTIGIDGMPTIDEGWESGKIVSFMKDINNPGAAGPDAEGITADSQGNLFIAAERDNSFKAENRNIILQVDPNSTTDSLKTIREWDLTEIIDNARKNRGMADYKVPNNEGIEAVEWIPNEVLEGNIIDFHIDMPYVASDYSTLNNGLFLVGVENDGFIYAFALSENGSIALVSQIDTGMGMVMGLDYNEPTNALWAHADNGRNNTLAKITFNGTTHPDTSYYKAPADFDVTENNEGFAIAKKAINNYLPTYWFMDGAKSRAMKLGWLYHEEAVDETEKETEEETVNETEVETNIETEEETVVETETELETPKEVETVNVEETKENETDKETNKEIVPINNNKNNPNTGDNGIWTFVALGGISVILLFVSINHKSKERK
ncbi:lamin tail domain-containing protein [Helcococcus kunzii]|uniref:lamin tail domain-containing protein n=1 Tax=Helcococcus kunzii TaxID=40091 RepID=UPI0038A3AB8A